MRHALVLGAGGFIGSHLVKRLHGEGFWVRGVDFYRGAPATVERIAERAKSLVGPDAIAGWMSPPIRPAGAMEDESVIASIAAARDMGGIGPAQAGVLDAEPRAPRWVQAVGMEWAHRVLSEPRRLWPRYRAVVPAAAALFTREVLRRPEPSVSQSGA